MMVRGAPAETRALPRRERRTRSVVRRDPGVLELVAALAAGALFVACAISGPPGAGAPRTTVQVTVHAGDTLWAIAAAHPVPGLATEEVVDAIMELNGLRTPLIEPGMRIAVPLAPPSERTLVASR